MDPLSARAGTDRLLPTASLSHNSTRAMAATAKYATFDTPPAAHPTKSANFVSRAFFAWALPLIRTPRQLNLDDVWHLTPETTCAANSAPLAAAYAESPSVVKAFLRVYGGSYFLMALLGLLLRLLELVGPIVLNKVVGAVDAPSTLYQWAGLLCLSMTSHAFLLAHCVVLEETTLVRFTLGLKGLLFQKLQRRSLVTNDVPELANIYTADLSTIEWGLLSLLSAWILPCQIVCIVYLLYREIGLAVFAGIAVIVVSMLIGGYISTLIGAAYDDVSTARDVRMKAVKESFGSVLIVKLQAWERQVAEKLAVLRGTELLYVWQLVRAEALGIFSMYAAPLAVSVASFVCYTLVLGHTLTPAKVFTSIALFRMLQEPMNQTPDNITGIIEAWTAIRRISEFLNQPDKPLPPPGLPTAPEVVLAMEGMDASWDNTTVHLTKLHLSICRGDLVVVHGKVGSGKSSLCMALLGEMHALSGRMAVNGRIGYCPQEPWVQHMSLRDNILFGRPFDAARYAAVVDACGLVADFEQMKFGDGTLANSKGANLSGGQKARLGLARAIYSDADILLLDAPLAAIDAVVQKEIFTKCILSLLATKTVVLVTHNRDIIDSAHVHQVIEMDDGGIVARAQRKPSAPPAAFKHASAEVAVAANDRWATYFHDAIDDDDKAETQEDEHREEGQVAGDIFRRFLAACGGGPTIAVVVSCQLLWQAFQVASDFWLSHWTSTIVATQKDDASYYLGVYGSLCLASVLMVLLRTITVARAGLRASKHLFEAMTTSLLAAPMRFFDATPSGRIINRYGDDVATIDTRLPINFGSISAVAAVLIASLATSIFVVGWAGLCFIPIFVLYFKLTVMYLRPSRDLARLAKITASPVLSFLDEIEHGFVSVRAFGAAYSAKQVNRHAHHVDMSARVGLAKVIVDEWFELMVQLAGTGVVMIVVISLVYLRPYLSAGIVGLAFNYILVANAYLADLVQSWSRLELSMVAPERVLEFCGLASEDDATSTSLVVSDTWHLARGDISFKNVSFRYKPTTDLVLRNLSLEISAGEKIGIVGRTGAGKSSLTMALFRLYPLASGAICIDGRDIATLSLHSLRHQISIIPQNPVLFKGSLRSYLDPFDAATDAALYNALRQVQLPVASLDDEAGANWSVGERQMLCLARALLAQARVVVLDEATAAIDHATDLHLQEVIANAFKDATVLTIAHRLHTVVHSDRVLVLEAGEAVAFGAPKALVQDVGSVFYNLAQDGGVLDLLLA
ncbi:hypothetical protein SPRG_08282 [Saprolegnia parasitica CBS 223.65]|uniref:Uncharacterized protein n=1 Tax=Saprolegnia parasitica (strain CBS 223.65) TaxID=695850 RepID=A0A067C6R1_SAPPC|nr:hypothetical protein SPRG_08282 [Saprolegnia parasitica CBS 223.65]KDO26479.1 hypothetical protein SPRG_08282 [Saprolegnia parasitica CBS 223.65]|eukprot:XP_012202914.1 hypothetical protein SPRG_08282 [Saprolegnia parasitica CBS 223.65]